MWVHGLYRNDTEQGQVADTGKSGDEHTASIKCEKFIEQLGTGYVLKKDCTSWSE